MAQDIPVDELGQFRVAHEVLSFSSGILLKPPLGWATANRGVAVTNRPLSESHNPPQRDVTDQETNDSHKFEELYRAGEETAATESTTESPPMHLKEIQRRIEASNYKPWQVYLLTASTLGGFGLYFEIGIIATLLKTLEGASAGWDWLVLLGIQGVLIGFAAESLYEQGDGYAKSASHLFGSKDRTLFFRIGVMTVVSGVITKIVPSVLEQATEYLVIQTGGAVIALGILLIHQGSSEWNARTEWPAIVAGAILAIAPSLA